MNSAELRELLGEARHWLEVMHVLVTMATETKRGYADLTERIDAALKAPDDSLDAAWAEAEAALPEGWNIRRVSKAQARKPQDAWIALAATASGHYGQRMMGRGPTPAAALRALAANLREAMA